MTGNTAALWKTGTRTSNPSRKRSSKPMRRYPSCPSRTSSSASIVTYASARTPLPTRWASQTPHSISRLSDRATLPDRRTTRPPGLVPAVRALTHITTSTANQGTPSWAAGCGGQTDPRWHCFAPASMSDLVGGAGPWWTRTSGACSCPRPAPTRRRSSRPLPSWTRPMRSRRSRRSASLSPLTWRRVSERKKKENKCSRAFLACRDSGPIIGISNFSNCATSPCRRRYLIRTSQMRMGRPRSWRWLAPWSRL